MFCALWLGYGRAKLSLEFSEVSDTYVLRSLMPPAPTQSASRTRWKFTHVFMCTGVAGQIPQPSKRYHDVGGYAHIDRYHYEATNTPLYTICKVITAEGLKPIVVLIP